MEGVAEIMLNSARKLAAAGADFLICPDNTIHQALHLVLPHSPLPNRFGDDWSEDRRASTFPDRRPADALDRTLDTISDRYGARTTNVVAMQLEYPRVN